MKAKSLDLGTDPIPFHEVLRRLVRARELSPPVACLLEAAAIAVGGDDRVISAESFTEAIKRVAASWDAEVTTPPLSAPACVYCDNPAVGEVLVDGKSLGHLVPMPLYICNPCWWKLLREQPPTIHAGARTLFGREAKVTLGPLPAQA